MCPAAKKNTYINKYCCDKVNEKEKEKKKTYSYALSSRLLHSAVCVPSLCISIHNFIFTCMSTLIFTGGPIDSSAAAAALINLIVIVIAAISSCSSLGDFTLSLCLSLSGIFFFFFFFNSSIDLDDRLIIIHHVTSPTLRYCIVCDTNTPITQHRINIRFHVLEGKSTTKRKKMDKSLLL